MKPTILQYRIIIYLFKNFIAIIFIFFSVLPILQSQHCDTILLDTSYYHGRFLKDYRHYQKFYELKTSLTGSSYKISHNSSYTDFNNSSILAIQIKKGSKAGRGALIGMFCGLGVTLTLVGIAAGKASSSDNPGGLMLVATGFSLSATLVFTGIGAGIGSTKKKYKTVYLNPIINK